MQRFTRKEFKYMAIFAGLIAFAGFSVYHYGPGVGVAMILGTTPVAYKMFPDY